MNRIHLYILLLLLCLSSATFAQENKNRLSYSQLMNFLEVDSIDFQQKEIEHKAQKGDAKAMEELGLYYLDIHNQKEAERWLLKSFKKGNQRAATILGLKNYIDGDGSKSVEWYLKAPDDPVANYLLAMAYLDSELPQYDAAKGIAYLKKSLQQDFPNAYWYMGNVLQFGEFGEKVDLKKAVEYYANAASAGLSDAQLSLGECYASGKGVERNDQLAFYWVQKAAEQEEPDALATLGAFYHDGIGVKVDMEKAYRLVCKADLMESEKGRFNKAIFMIEGAGTEVDEPHGVQILKPYADDGDDTALYYLARAYLSEEGVPADYEKALKYANASAEKGNEDAVKLLAAMYMNGEGVEKNVAKAEEILQNAIDRDSTEFSLRYMLVEMLVDKCLKDAGQDVENLGEKVDVKRIEKLLEPCMEAGDLPAICSYVGLKMMSRKFQEAYDLLKRLEDKSKAKGDSTFLKLAGGMYYALVNHLVENDTKENIALATRIADDGNATVEFMLGGYYYRKKNMKLAREFYRRAAKHGNKDAEVELKYLEE